MKATAYEVAPSEVGQNLCAQSFKITRTGTVYCRGIYMWEQEAEEEASTTGVRRKQYSGIISIDGEEIL